MFLPRLIAACLGSLILGTAHADPFEFRPERVPVGQVFHYLKSNVDGSNAGRISVYVARPDRIESFKHHDGTSKATLVIADMDWSRFSVRRFEAWHLEANHPPQQRAWLQASPDGSEVTTSLFERKVKLHHWPWHSYDFDFASLSLTMPHAVRPDEPIDFWRTDTVSRNDTFDFAEIGAVHLEPLGIEMHAGHRTRRYRIAGAGLDGTSGTLWIDADAGFIVEYQIPIADEPGYRDGRLRLTGIESMTGEQWERFRIESLTQSR